MNLSSNKPSLRQQAVQGTVFLVLRQMVAFGLGVAGLFYMTRVVGAEDYGLYAAAFGVSRYLGLIGDSGVKMYLLRAPQNQSTELFHQAFWWLCFASLGTVILTLPVIIILGSFWITAEGFVPVAIALMLGLPASLLASVPTAILERGLQYRQVALIEMLSQASYYGTGIMAAWRGWGVWAFVIAFWSGQVISCVGYFWSARFRPHWYWDAHTIRQMVRESIKLGSAALVYEMRLLLAPLVLLPLTNEAIVGYYSLSHRLLTTLGFVRDAVARLSVPIYARLQEQPDKLLESVRLSSLAQMLGLAGIYLPLVLLGVYVLPSVFGSKWDIPSVLLAFSVLAANQLFFVIFGALNQALLVVRQAHVFMKAGGAYIGVSAALSAGLILVAPEPYKLLAYVIGVSLAYVPTYYWMMHRSTVRYIAKPRYGMNLIWAAGLGAAMFAPFTHYWSLLGLLVFLHPASLRAAREVKALLLEARQSKKKGAQASDQNTV